MPRLQVLNGKRQGAVFEVGPGAEHLIGHRQSATISIDDPWVSWDHARVFWEKDGSCWIEDLGSTNGTYVNCVRVKREVLRHEDIVFLGKTHVIFLAPAVEGAPVHDPFASSPVDHAPDPFQASSEGAAVALPQDRAPTGSSLGGFESDDGATPLRDPFASANAPPGLAAAAMAASAGTPWGGAAPPLPPTPSGHWPSPPARQPSRDPFDESSGDPFDTGQPGAAPPPPPQPRGRAPAGTTAIPADPFARPAPAPRSVPPGVDPFARPVDPFARPELDPFARPPVVRDTKREDPYLPDPFGEDDAPDFGAAIDPFAPEPVDPFAPAPVDPFAPAPVDPFASEPADPFAGPPPDAQRTKRAFADTHADDDGPAALTPLSAAASASTGGGGKKSLSLSDLREDVEAAAAPSSHEISQLIDRGDFDDLDTILGDGRAMTPDPSRMTPPVKMPVKPKPPPLGSPSEMRTRPISTDLAREILAADDAASAAAAAPSTGKAPPVTSHPTPLGVSAPPLASRPTPTMPLQAADPLLGDEPTVARSAAATDLGALAFERARLDDEVRRLRAALQAAQQRSPQAIKIAADALRDQELGRLARRVAELERDLVMVRQEVGEKQVELDRVTDEMIDKEDRIDQLEEEVRRLRGGASPVDIPHGLGASDDADPLDF